MLLLDYEIRDSRPEDRPDILRILMDNFVRDEPALKLFLEQYQDRISREERRLMMDDYARLFEHYLDHLLCRVVVHQSKHIVGVSLMCVEDGGLTLEDLNKQVLANSSLLAEFHECIIHRAEETVDFFRDFPHIKSTLELVILTTDVKHRGRGLASALMHDAMDLGRSKGIDIVFGQFTSPYSQKAARKMGFRTYLDVDAMKLHDLEGKVFYHKGGEPFVISEMFLFL